MNENIALFHFKRKRKSLIYLNSHKYIVVPCLYFQNNSEQKLNALVPRLL